MGGRCRRCPILRSAWQGCRHVWRRQEALARTHATGAPAVAPAATWAGLTSSRCASLVTCYSCPVSVIFSQREKPHSAAHLHAARPSSARHGARRAGGQSLRAPVHAGQRAQRECCPCVNSRAKRVKLRCQLLPTAWERCDTRLGSIGMTAAARQARCAQPAPCSRPILPPPPPTGTLAPNPSLAANRWACALPFW